MVRQLLEDAPDRRIGQEMAEHWDVQVLSRSLPREKISVAPVLQLADS